MAWNHWVARTNHHYQPFVYFDLAQATWDSLYKEFPQRISAVLMPNHLHLILPAGENEKEVQRTLKRILITISRKIKAKNVWQPIPLPATIPDRHHLRRQIRYIALNPCRKALCQDPLEWPWSTYREIVGATIRQSDTIQKISHLFGDRSRDFAVRFHAYVSGDPSVRVDGTPPATLARPGAHPIHSLIAIQNATAAALQIKPSAVLQNANFRKVFIQSAYRHGWTYPTILGKHCKISRQAIYPIPKKTSAETARAIDLCLGDPRLTKFFQTDRSSEQSV